MQIEYREEMPAVAPLFGGGRTAKPVVIDSLEFQG